MTPFLKQVADHYHQDAQVEKMCFIFPNRRSMAFFNKYFREGVKRPMRMPSCLTINDFFYRAHGAEVEDKVTLLLELYSCYCKVYPEAESLDEFISWGEVILNDFADVDKYLVDPKQVFTNVAEFKGMQDDYSYMTEAQRQALDEFISHFRDSSGLKPNAKGDNVKSRFLRIWDMLLPLYEEFNKVLRSKNMAYDGMVYRNLSEKISEVGTVDFFREKMPRTEKFVFVGLNALNESERKVLKKMLDCGIAEFCWDYSSSMLKNLRNRASAYMSQNVADFKQTWKLDPDGLGEPEINVISVPSSVGQAKQLPSIFAEAGLVRNPDCTDIAVVLPDENLLMPVLDSIPSEIEDINVTMGYPMSSSNMATLMNGLSALQLHARKRGDEWLFYHKQVRSILSGGIIPKILDDAGRDIVSAINADARYYVPQSAFKGSEILELVFSPVVTEPNSSDPAQIARLEDYQTMVIEKVAPLLLENPDLAVEVEFAKRYYSCVNLLKDKSLAVKPVTYVRLLSQLTAGESVPFEGEPLKGLQIMGPLETRGLDFRNVVILSCNEGIFPKKNSSTSFIPPELRKGFGLPTNDFKDAVLAYSFYRLIQRAERVWLVYDSRMEKMKAGEESRYIKQLEYHFRKPLRRYVAKAKLSKLADLEELRKPDDIEERLKNVTLSVSSLQDYLSCPAKFYFSKICGLEKEREVAESMDAGMTGNVYHAMMQALYLGEKAMEPGFSMDRTNIRRALDSRELIPLEYVTAEYIGSWIARKKELSAKIRALMKEELRSIDITGRDLVMEKIILEYVLKTLQRDKELLKAKNVSRFRVIGLELPVSWKCDGYKFFGYIDRVDSFEDGTVRIVDYKTGKVEDKDVNITDANAAKIVEALFRDDNDQRPKIALQLFLYGKYVEDMPWAKGKTLINVIYPAATLFTTRVEAMEKPRSEVFGEAAMEKVREKLSELSDKTKTFRRTKSEKICSYCDFRNICGR